MAQGGFSSGMDVEDGEETEDFWPLPFMDPFILGLKKEGDEKFEAQLYAEAAATYTIAMNCPTLPFMDTSVIAEKLFRKRAVCFYKMGKYLEAIHDCERAIEHADCSNNKNLLAKSVFIKMKAIVCLGDFVPAFKLAVWCKHLRPNCEKTKECLNDIKEKLREAFTKDRSLVKEVLETMIDFAETLNIENNTREVALESYTELLDLLDFMLLPGVLQRQAEILMNLGRYEEAKDICAKVLWLRRDDLEALELMRCLKEREKKQAKETKEQSFYSSTQNKTNEAKRGTSLVEMKAAAAESKDCQPLLSKVESQASFSREQSEKFRTNNDAMMIDSNENAREHDRENAPHLGHKNEHCSQVSEESPLTVEMNDAQIKMPDSDQTQSKYAEAKENEKAERRRKKNRKKKKKKKEKKKAQQQMGGSSDQAPVSNVDEGSGNESPDEGDSQATDSVLGDPDILGYQTDCSTIMGDRKASFTTSNTTFSTLEVNQDEDSDGGDFIPVQNTRRAVLSTAKPSNGAPEFQKPFGERASVLDWIDAPSGQEYQSIAEVNTGPLTPEPSTSQLQGIPASVGFRKEDNASTSEVRRSLSFDEFPNLTKEAVNRPTPDSMQMHTSGNAWVSISPPDASLPNSSLFQSEVRPRNVTNEQFSSMSYQGIPGQTSSSTGFACFTRTGQAGSSSNPVTFSQSFQTNSAKGMHSLNPPPGLAGPIRIPEGVFVVCDHFLQNIITAKTCKFCEERGILKYAAWNKDRYDWQVMRPYPRYKVPPRAIFDVCKHFASDRPCPKDPCTFPHGEQERIMWTLERQGLLASPEESLQLMRASIPVASMIAEPVVQENGRNNLPLHMPENRGAPMASIGDSTVEEFPGLEAVSSQSSTTSDSNNTSASIWSSPLEMSGGSFETVSHLQGNVVTTSQEGSLDAISSQSSTADSSDCTTSSARSSVLNQSEIMFTPVPPVEKTIIGTSHVSHTEAVSSQNSPADSTECTASRTWSSVVKQSERPSALPVSPSAKHPIATSTSPESSGRLSPPVLPTPAPANMTSQVAHSSGSSQSSAAGRSTITSSSARSRSLESKRSPSSPVPLTVKPATTTSPAPPASKTGSVPSPNSYNDITKIPRGVYVVCDDFLRKHHKLPASINKKTKACKACKNLSRLKYAVWNDNGKQWQLIRPYPAEKVPANVAFQECAQFSSNKPCLKNPCSFAHGPLELAMWTKERDKSRAPFGWIADSEVSPQENDSQDIPKPQERAREPSIILGLMSNKPRPPPTGLNNGKFKLCEWWKSGRVCRYGTHCTSAHGEDELKSWMGYNREIQESKSEGELSCQKPETSADMSRSEIQMVYSLPGVEISSNKDTSVKISHRGEEGRFIFHWQFTVKFEIREVGKLCEIDLLHRYHDCYQLKKIMGFLNNVEIFSEVPEDKWLYKLPSSSGIDTKEGQMEVVVSVSFETIASNRTFTQCLRFDFGRKPYLLQGLNVDIASEEALDTLSATRQELKLHSSVWTEGSVKIIPSPETTGLSSQDMLLLKKYKLPERIENVISAQIIDGKMKVEDYKRVMHQLLFTEELFMKKAISSFVLQNVQLDCQQSITHDWSGVVYAGSGELFGILQFQESLQPDDTASRLLVRNVNCAWIKMVGSSSQKVYEAVVEKVKNECVALKFSSQICSDLNVSVGGQIFVDVQFQLNRKPLCEWHAAIDRLGPIQLRLLFPTPGAPQIKLEERRPWNWLPLDPKLNTNQREVIKRILAPGDTSSPLVVFGPFGTGKTFTLNQAIRHLVAKKHNRILLCTHTNSAADIHVTLLHNYLTTENGLNATKPIRIYQPDRRINADSKIARMYGLIVNNAYVLPTRDDVIRHRVVITTLAMSQHLFELQLNRGFFTHILVDEAAQALEPEALTPLALAGPNTKIVFTGDHMQMSPEVYSHYARDWGLQRSLPERLFDHYCEKMHSDSSVMFLTENYRSHPDILQFPSYNFYGEGLIARSEQASHPRFGTLLFFSVHGVEEARENSYINAAEIDEIVKRVELLADDWPVVEWKKKDLSKIGVISAYMTQVRAIRTQLRSKGLGNVTVESIHNVQGKEFRALFISTVRTSLTCHSFERRQSESQSPCREFLSDRKLLNTAITRAMSLVAVVGDPVSLCTVGDCRGDWRDYIRRCHEHGTLHGVSYEEIKKNINDPPAKITLNAEAKQFVPQLMDVSSKELTSLELASQTEISDSQISSSLEKTDLEIDKNEKSSASEIKDKCTIPTEKYRSEIETNDTKEDLTQRESTSEEDEEEHTETEFSPDSSKNGYNYVKRSEDMLSQNQGDFAFQDESQSGIQSHAKEEAVEQSTSDGFEELPRESFEDETVFPRYLDKIIEALVEKCKATREKEAHLCGPSENAAFSSLQTATTSSNKSSKSKTVKRSSKRARQEKSSSFNYSSADYEVRVVNGRQEVRIINLGFYQMPSVRHQRLTTASRQEDFLEPQLLQQLLVKEPEKYLSCTLRFNSEIIRTAYAEISDTKTPDIKIRGRVRGAFDMDHVVVEKTDCQPPSYDGATRCQGKVTGVLNHIINPHERQYVCKVDYENPGVMIPINKSMSKIVNLSDKNLNGLPIYRERRDGRERPFEVDVMDFTEALSGKFLFLVQYLHWRSGYQSPTGIVIRKLTQGNTLFDSMKILFAEHGVRDCFSKESEAEVRSKFPPGWSIPVEEYGRQKIDKAFTIDPANSKDLDDALTLEQLSDSISRVGVHIADVSYFVEPGTELDKDAMFRSTSYYPGHDYPSVPMLPRELSENHCSLLPGKDRLCVSVFLNVSEKGQLIGQPEIRRTIVRSSCQLTYPEAQKVIDGQDTSLLQIPQDVKGNIRSLSALAQRRRKLRLRNASLDHWSNSDDGEDFEAHELVEEMMLLANEEIGKFLSRSQQMSERTPLRTQLPPKNHKLDDWVRQHGQFIKYSLFLRGFYSENTLREMENQASISEDSERFKVQESVWSELCNVMETGDQAKLHQLICDESNHPQLAVANSQFRRIQPKSQYVCKSDEPKENIAHFSLGMGCYTHFTSPIRRYIDIQVHRLVLGLISPSPNARISSKDHVAKICRRSTFAQDNSRKFGKASSKVHLAAKLKEKSHETTAVIALIDTDKEITLEILNREYNHLSTRQRKVKLSSLNPFDVKPTPNDLEVTWRLRLFIAPEGNSIEEPEKEKEKIALLLSEGMARNSKVLDLPTENWLEILKAFQEGDYRKLKKEIRKTERARQLASRVHGSNRPKKRQKTSKDDTNLEHFYEKKLSLRKFDVVSIQLNAHMVRGVLHPEIQLFKINPIVHICIEHRKYPRECFATTARYQASRKTYASARKYIEAWEPVLAMEAATGTVRESDEFTIHHVKIEWEKDINGNLEGSFCLQNEYCLSRQIEFHAGDFVCVRVREDSYVKKTGSENKFAFHEKTKTEGGTNLLNEDHQLSVTTSAAPYVRGKPRHESSCASESFWVGHCIINHYYTKELPNEDTLKVVTMDLHQSASDFPVELLNGGDHLSTLTVIHRSLPHRRMFAALRSLPRASQLAHSICMGHEPNQEEFGPIPSAHLSIVREHPNCGFKPLNQYQEEAVKEALVNPFTLVQGPPGTGKTVTGVHIAYWFVKRNMQQRQDDLDIVLPDSDDQPKGPHTKVMYCGPSNKSVDVVAKYMLTIPGLKIIRVYGDRREQAEFPIPNKRQPLKNPTDDETQILNEDNELKAVSLHHVIRRSPSPFAAELKEYELKFDADRKNGLRTSNKEVKEYRELIANAECWALQQTGVQIILCTCVASGKPRLTRSCGNIQQCIVDECGMCMELESLVPITCSEARQVVLIGDHKQLQPIIQDNLAMTLGLSVSMFERLSERAKMLELQYRMQEEICRFPSKYFYEKKLKTDSSVPSLDPRLQSFWPAWKSGKNVPMAFCHVEGEEESSSITTAHSNEQSKANEKEVRKVVHVATSLTYKYNVDASKVVILSPYREQRSKISESLKKVYRCKNIPVTTIVKSQGSEWDYVILSLVRSLSEDEIEPKPSLHWLREHLGFLTDEHQMNVGLTRARKGLCIIGNKNLLKVHPMWLDLINSYEENHCLVNESDWP